ncbi:MAG: SGNH/GDSL hydrolase family protein [Lachnospiraceae bacterium]|nr:SGNH/GDSL hydrolase family protein [Lachnospiraceae bacterium]
MMRKLEPEELSRLVFGAWAVFSDERGTRFSRMPEEQIALAKQISEVYETRARNDAGIFLDFMTGSPELEIGITMLHDYEGCPIVLEVLVNGESLGILRRDSLLDGSGRLSMHLPSGRNRVTVFLSGMCRITLTEFSVTEGAEVTPLPKKRKLLFLGDSITQGYHAEHPSKAFPSQIAWRTDSDLLNLGIGGARFDPGSLDEALVYPVDRIFVSYGTNDWRHSECSEAFRTYPGAFFQKLKKMYPDTPIDVILPIWRKESEIPGFGNGDFLGARRYYARLAEGIGARVIDTWDYVPHEEDFFYDRKLHPNDKGMGLLAEGLLKAIGTL